MRLRRERERAANFPDFKARLQPSDRAASGRVWPGGEVGEIRRVGGRSAEDRESREREGAHREREGAHKENSWTADMEVVHTYSY